MKLKILSTTRLFITVLKTMSFMELIANVLQIVHIKPVTLLIIFPAINATVLLNVVLGTRILTALINVANIFLDIRALWVGIIIRLTNATVIARLLHQQIL